MRPFLILAAALALAVGCATDEAAESKGADAPAEDDGSGSGGDLGGGPADSGGCAVDADCVAAASSCCECPTFAVPSREDTMGCDAVQCDEPEAECGLLEPACSAGTCVLVCAPVVATQTCETGFERDVDGCLLDQCAAPLESGVEPGCSVDEDCVQVAADCCGCARGGEDTAVPADQVSSYEAGLGCTGGESCPEVDVCVEGAVPTCVAGSCTLVGGEPPVDPGDNESEPPVLCGTTSLAPCPEGQVCVLNARNATQADALAVGVCLGE